MSIGRERTTLLQRKPGINVVEGKVFGRSSRLEASAQPEASAQRRQWFQAALSHIRKHLLCISVRKALTAACFWELVTDMPSKSPPC